MVTSMVSSVEAAADFQFKLLGAYPRPIEGAVAGKLSALDFKIGMTLDEVKTLAKTHGYNIREGRDMLSFNITKDGKQLVGLSEEIVSTVSTTENRAVGAESVDDFSFFFTSPASGRRLFGINETRFLHDNPTLPDTVAAMVEKWGELSLVLQAQAYSNARSWYFDPAGSKKSDFQKCQSMSDDSAKLLSPELSKALDLAMKYDAWGCGAVITARLMANEVSPDDTQKTVSEAHIFIYDNRLRLKGLEADQAEIKNYISRWGIPTQPTANKPKF
ncbi:hypothetical protein CO665_34665 [Rhizobium anhuiense]|nr:hypothetical protein CO665_34665 [Rhizobium anhuiense]